MNSTIGEPFLLSSYALRRQIPRPKNESGSKKVPAKIHVSSDSSSKNLDGYVTIAAQGDGVHVFDVWSFLYIEKRSFS
jgi:hypothetical protein